MTKKSTFKSARLRQILDVVPYDQGFHFYAGLGNYIGVTASSLAEFAEKLRIIDATSVRFHFQRGDFQKWTRLTLGDAEIARRISYVKVGLSDEALRDSILSIVLTRIDELRTLF
jgi:hypothetical protein